MTTQTLLDSLSQTVPLSATRAKTSGATPLGEDAGRSCVGRHRGQLAELYVLKTPFFLERIANSNNLRIVDEQQSNGHTANSG